MRIVIGRHASGLGHWTYAEYRPPELAAFVDRFWQSRGAVTMPRKRILPNGKIELLVNLGRPIRLAEGAGSPVLVRGWLSGIQARPLVIEMEPTQHVLAVRLRPAGAYALFARPMDELVDLTVDLDAVVGRAAEELTERCAHAGSVKDRFAEASAWVRERLEAGPRIDSAIAWAEREIAEHAGGVAIRGLRDSLGVSKASFARRFKTQIGVAPKVYARIHRFRRALSALHRGDCALAQVALDAGFYDQAHLTGEFRRLSGLTPGAFVRRPHYAQSLSVAEGSRVRPLSKTPREAPSTVRV